MTTETHTPMLRLVFRNILKANSIKVEDLGSEAWEIFQNYGDLLRFDALNLMMAALKNSGRSKLEFVVAALQAHYQAVKSQKVHDRFHDEITPQDIQHVLHSNSTHQAFSYLSSEVGIRKVRPKMVRPSAEIRPVRCKN